MWTPWMLALLACGTSPEPPAPSEGGGASEEAAPSTPAPEPEPEPDPSTEDLGPLTPFEARLLTPQLARIREGVRPFTGEGLSPEEAVGICAGADGRDCPVALGRDAGVLPPGDYALRALLDVPRVGPPGTWSVTFALDCDVVVDGPDGPRATERTTERRYEVQWAGPERAYRLAPVWRITSPARRGRESCRWTLTLDHPDTPTVIEGSWSTP